ncbi:heterokaryon incompatibility protein-domain-containing protein [Daedaleopsis nitida]|nr:heterokaryon incompatibility protein-domain-containing protein [Daedaleopsis nitida]
MWLLRTDRAELQFFVSPETVPAPGFAIFSHVWDDEEQSFQRTEALRVQCSTTGENPRDLASEKIRKACELAEQHGYKWLWLDTCCIDKTSSAELSEAINSMFYYYSVAAVCYAYLRDVPLSTEDDITDLFYIRRRARNRSRRFSTLSKHSKHPLDDKRMSRRMSKTVTDISSVILHGLDLDVLKHSRESSKGAMSGLALAFALSKWHRRGWTLQELVAPRNVLFLSQAWDILGSKTDFAASLEHITGIPAAVLRTEEHCGDFSVAQRMSWAANRSTTRLEDEAYCLLGIFGVNMPTLYGEGRNAFRRLQEEIMKQSADTSLLVWGLSARVDDGEERNPYLLASSPSAFGPQCGRVRYTPSPPREPPRPKGLAKLKAILRGERERHSDSHGITYFSFTPHGVVTSIPISQRVYEYVFWDLACSEDSPSPDVAPLKLFMILAPSRSQSPDPARPSYRCKGICRESTLPDQARRSLNGTKGWKWTEVLLEHSPAAAAVPRTLTIRRDISPILAFHSPFHFLQMHASTGCRPVSCTRADANLGDRVDYPSAGLNMTKKDSDDALAIFLRSAEVIPFPFQFSDTTNRHSSARFYLHTRSRQKYVLSLGLCLESSSGSQTSTHWANIRLRKPGEAEPSSTLKLGTGTSSADHDCANDHIHQWPGLTRIFSIVTSSPPHPSTTSPQETFTLAFSRCLVNPDHTLDLKLTMSVQDHDTHLRMAADTEFRPPPLPHLPEETSEDL